MRNPSVLLFEIQIFQLRAGAENDTLYYFPFENNTQRCFPTRSLSVGLNSIIMIIFNNIDIIT